MTAQTKEAIGSEVNRLILGSGYNRRRETGEHKALCALMLGGQEDAKKSEDRVPLKVWKMIIPEARIAMRSGEEVKIVLAEDSSSKTGRIVGGKMYQQHKNIRAKFLRLIQSEGKKNDAMYMKSVNEFINNCGCPS